MIKDVEKVIDWLELNGLQYWTVSTTQDDNKKVFDSVEDETYEDRKRRFREVMKLSYGGRYVIKAKKNKTDGRGLFTEEFSNIAETSGVGGFAQQPQTITGISKEDVSEMLRKERESWEREQELKNLREQVKSLTSEVKEKDTAMNRIMNKIDPYIGAIVPHLINKFIPGAPQVAMGTTTQTIPPFQNTDADMDTNITDDQLTERVENAIEKWQTADPEFLPVLEFIAEFAASGNPIDAGFMKLSYDQVKGMLK
jgi:hypothetical protein